MKQPTVSLLRRVTNRQLVERMWHAAEVLGHGPETQNADPHITDVLNEIERRLCPTPPVKTS
jgi:hypothetical protein